MFKKTILIGILATIFLSCPVDLTNASKINVKNESVIEKILHILIEKKIINKTQYKELLSQLKEKKKTKRKIVKLKTKCGYDKGFYIETTDKQNKIKLSGRFQGDFKAYLGNHPENSSFFVRRARLAMTGTLFKYYDFRVESEFGKGNARLNDGFMNIHYWPQFQIMFGQFKAPFWMEELTSDNWIDFVERSIAISLLCLTEAKLIPLEIHY